jgi:hypothetical protein
MMRAFPAARGALLVFALALAVRALFLFATSDRGWPHSAFYEGDAPVWARWAAALDRGEPFEFDLPMRTPGVAFLLHWATPGNVAPPFTAWKLVWCALGAATCAALFAVVRGTLGSRTAWIAALFATFGFGSYQLATSLNGEAPYALLLVLLVGATARWSEAPRGSLALALGVLHGAALLLRAEHALLLVLFLAWGVLATRSAAGWRTSALIAAVAVLACAPWSLRSRAAAQRFNAVEEHPVDFALAQPPWSAEAQAFLLSLPAFAREGNFAYAQYLAASSGKSSVELGDLERYFDQRFGYRPEPLAEWTLVSSKGPLDFALANHPASDGGFSRAALLDGLDPAPEFAFGRPSHLKLYNHGYAAGFAWIRADPAAWLGLVGRKLERFFAGAALGWTAWDLPHGRDLRRRPVDLAVPLAPSVLAQACLAACVAAGVWLAGRTTVGALCLIVIAHKLAIAVLFYGYARQAVSIHFAFAVLAAVALDALLARARVPERVAAGSLVALAAVFLAGDVAYVSRSRDFDVRPAHPNAVIGRTPEWGAGAFEAVDEVEILPRR